MGIPVNLSALAPVVLPSRTPDAVIGSVFRTLAVRLEAPSVPILLIQILGIAGPLWRSDTRISLHWRNLSVAGAQDLPFAEQNVNFLADHRANAVLSMDQTWRVVFRRAQA